MRVETLLVPLLALCGVESAKILGIFPMTARSHYILGNALLKGLAAKGHDVTMIGCFSDKKPPTNGTYREIILTNVIEEYERKSKEINMFAISKLSVIVMTPFIVRMTLQVSEGTILSPEVQKLLNSGEKFDVVIVEQFMNDAHKAFANHFGAQLVVVSTMGASSWVNYIVGNPGPLSYIPSILLDYSSAMTFEQRVRNALMYIWEVSLRDLYLIPQQTKLVQKHFPNVPPLDDIIYNASIVFLNSHPSTSQPLPLVPNMIEIGGYHVQPPQKLPKDLQEFLDAAKDGAIYFSLGSHIKSSQLPVDKRQAILNTFSKLKQRVLWKWEEDSLPGQPPNVKTAKWLPQQDILAHPNIKLFISHSGLLSITETIYHGVPVLALPIGGDQRLNAKRIINEGFGLMLDHSDLTEEDFTEKVNELLTNPKYSQNAKKRSALFHDRLVSPMDTAVYWVEYVIRNGGASHLRVEGVNLPWYKYHLLDVIAFLAVTSLLGFYVTYRAVKKLFSLCSKQRKEKVKIN